ncbi:hypothetical protein LXA43DRAFT_1064038 [Ganoderma leucocontextum]|nr:hypothetical protein LXA43DRAFT_1064027 [Ganoderma leucocontextum]KAI1787867.1 hypothetical protein LXA43DRAFT_1064038 [Ganoderma leucocontextum]
MLPTLIQINVSPAQAEASLTNLIDGILVHEFAKMPELIQRPGNYYCYWSSMDEFGPICCALRLWLAVHPDASVTWTYQTPQTHPLVRYQVPPADLVYSYRHRWHCPQHVDVIQGLSDDPGYTMPVLKGKEQRVKIHCKGLHPRELIANKQYEYLNNFGPVLPGEGEREHARGLPVLRRAAAHALFNLYHFYSPHSAKKYVDMPFYAGRGSSGCHTVQEATYAWQAYLIVEETTDDARKETFTPKRIEKLVRDHAALCWLQIDLLYINFALPWRTTPRPTRLLGIFVNTLSVSTLVDVKGQAPRIVEGANPSHTTSPSHHRAA